MDVCKVFVPIGALGAGIDEKTFWEGMAKEPDIISLDAGSTDSGPFYLGTGAPKYAMEAVKSDLRFVLQGAHKQGIPVTIGTCGTCGTDNMVDEVYTIAQEIFSEDNIQMRTARIYTEQRPETIAAQYKAGKIRSLEGAPDINEDTFAQCDHIVALAGREPFETALRGGAQLVLCGRATDTAIIAVYPIMNGFDKAMAWHGAKIAECGALCTENPTEDGVLLTFDHDGLIVEATAAGNTCTVYSVSAHLLYENADPIRLTEPGCVIDTSETVYTQLPEGRVRVQNTKYEQQPYTMKLEGSGFAGYQTLSLVGIRDPKICADPMSWLEMLTVYMAGKLEKLGQDKSQYSYSLRPYGWNAVYGGKVPDGYVANEIGLLFTATATTQELATKVAKVFNPYLLHFPTSLGTPLPSYAFPFSPAETEHGAVYEFKLNHVIELDDPLAIVRIDIDEK